jgi:multidrug efflux pump
MGTVIVGGTLFSLVLTLFVIPAIYSYWAKPYKPNKQLKDAHRFEQEALNIEE